MARDPLALRARLQQHASRGHRTEYGGESVRSSGNAALLDGAVIAADAELSLALVQVEPYGSHGWPAG